MTFLLNAFTLICSGNYNKVYKIKTAARDGSYKETTVTDDDLKRLMDLPDVDLK